jgi:hypothetical protein
MVAALTGRLAVSGQFKSATLRARKEPHRRRNIIYTESAVAGQGALAPEQMRVASRDGPGSGQIGLVAGAGRGRDRPSLSRTG